MGDSDDGARIGCQKLANLRLGGGREVAGWLVQKEDVGAVFNGLENVLRLILSADKKIVYM